MQIFFLGALPGYLLARKGQTLVKKEWAAVSNQNYQFNENPYVLYLRSFSLDKKKRKSPRTSLNKWDIHTEEENVKEAFSIIGDFVALGIPAEKLPELGAIRKYVPQEKDWRLYVKEIMKHAKLVVFRAGNTDGLLTEIELAIEILAPKQILFIVPGDLEEYDRFKKMMWEKFNVELPAYYKPASISGSIGGLLIFEDNWMPRYLPINKYAMRRPIKNMVIATRIRMTLRPVLERLLIKWKAPPLNFISVIVITVIAGLILIFITILIIFLFK